MTRFVKWFVAVGIATTALVLIGDIFLPIDMRVAANVSLLGMALGTTVFAVGYGLRSNWWNSRIGPTYLAYKASMAMVLWQIAVAVWITDTWPGRHHVRYAFYSLGAIFTVVWALILRDAQKRRTADGVVLDNTRGDEGLPLDDFVPDPDRSDGVSGDGGD